MSADTRAASRAAVIAAAVMIAQQIAGKATRDALFLDQFSVAALPPMVITNSIVSLLVALAVARYLTRHGPGAVLPATFLASGLLFFLALVVLPVAPGAVAITLQLHMAALGGIAVSTFWALVNERFDPHTAKRQVNRIVAGASVGGLVGGLLAERVAATVGLTWMLPVLGVMHFFCAWRVLALRAVDRAPVASAPVEPQSGLQHLASMPYLRNLAGLLVLTTIAAAFIDFVFKAEAAAWFGHDRDAMLRFFALFATASSALALVAQALFTRATLQRFGLVRTASILPLTLIGIGAAAVALPGLLSATALRGGQDVMRNSFFRSAYELLYNPLPRAAKRATKLIIDVGVDRLGDAIGAGVIAALLLTGPELALVLLVWGVMVLAGLALAVAVKVHRGYVAALEVSLVTQAEALDLDALRDSTTRLTVLQTLGTLDLPDALKRRAERATPGAVAPPEPAPRASEPSAELASADPVVAQVAALRSGDRARVEATLMRPDLDPTTSPHVIVLLAWDDVHRAALDALRRLAPRITGQLADALHDRDGSFAIRRRVPRALRFADPGRARDALMYGLDDPRFEVRYQCARALHRLIAETPEQGGGVDATAHATLRRDIYMIVLRELEVAAPVWAGHRLLDAPEAEEAPLIDERLVPQADRGLEHVFNLLALVHPRRPIRVALHGLMTDDATLRGTALEYLDSALPEPLRASLRRVAADGDRRPAETPRSLGETAKKLVEAMPTIELHLKALLARKP